MKASSSAMFVACAALIAGCGDRPDFWDTSTPSPPSAVAAEGAVAVLDAPARRVVLLAPDGDLSLAATPVAIGKGARPLATTPDRRTVLALTRGDVPRRTADAEAPALFAIDASDGLGLRARYPLTDPLSGLAVDPQGTYAIVHAESDDASFVSNPNELVVVDLSRAPSAQNPAPLTLRSFGGRPERLDFTTSLGLPGGPKRLLVAETDRDVALLDLANPTSGEVTVRLTSSSARLTPAGSAITDGDPARDDDARIALRFAGDPNVVIIDLLPPTEAAQGAFRASPNIVGLPSAPTDIAFVRTDGGLRLAAVLPQSKSLALVDPATGTSSSVALGDAYERMALVTDVVQGTNDAADVALLWSPSRPLVAIVALGKTVGKPYKSVDVVPLEMPVASVLAVPPPRAHLRVLATAGGGGFFVLDLSTRTASPLTTSRPGISLTLAPDGGRAWVHVPGSPDLASLDLGVLHPENLQLTRSIHSTYDVRRRDGGRALVALHAVGALGATVLDGRSPSLLHAREHAGLLLSGAP